MSSAVIKFIITANYNHILQQLQLQQLQLQQLGTTTIQIQFTISTIKQTTITSYNRINKGKIGSWKCSKFLYVWGQATYHVWRARGTRDTVLGNHVILTGHVTLTGPRASRDTCYVLLTSGSRGSQAYRLVRDLVVTFLQYGGRHVQTGKKRRVIT